MPLLQTLAPQTAMMIFHGTTHPRPTTASSIPSIPTGYVVLDELEREHHQKLPFPFVVGRDVLCGRGETVKVLNKHYRQHIARRHADYVRAPTGAKRAVARAICTSIHCKGGRFVNMTGQALRLADAEDKIMKALRDCGRQQQKQQQQQQQQQQQVHRDGRQTYQRQVSFNSISSSSSSSMPQHQQPQEQQENVATPQQQPMVVSPMTQRRPIAVVEKQDVLDCLHLLDDTLCTFATKDEMISEEEGEEMIWLDPIPVVQDAFVGGICQRAAHDATFRHTLAWLATLE